MSKAILASTAEKIRRFAPGESRVLVGLDGFVDLIIDAVDKRTGPDAYTRVETLATLGERISRAAGMSSNLELVVRQRKLGGNGPNMAQALLEAGCAVTYIGNLGRPALHPVFADMAKRCKACYSLAEPGVTDALEFRDGKLMLGKHESLREVTYERMVEVVGLDRLRGIWAESNLVALTNWTMLTAQTEIWKSLHRDMKGTKPPAGAILFTDLADPEKRHGREVAEAVRFLKSFRSSHRVVLGLNQKESLEVGTALGLGFKSEEIEKNASTLRRELDLDAVVIHPTRNAACATERSSATFDGPFCANPKLTTGAGDNFNAGFCWGLLQGLSSHEAAKAAVLVSSLYVEQGRSPKRSEILGALG